jgi:NADH-quinone oxidoreductase subunit J
MEILFYLAAALAVVGALGVVLQRTPVYSALWLIVVLCALAGIYLLLGAEFMAMIQVIVYAGAIMVLFVMVIMLLNAGREEPGDRSRMARWLGAPLVAVFIVMLITVIWRQYPPELSRWAFPAEGGPAAIGRELFRNYVLAFEVTAVLILVALVGAVMLAKKQA